MFIPIPVVGELSHLPLEEPKTNPLQDIWVQFMCASMSADYSVDYAATKADLALEEYKKRFQ